MALESAIFRKKVLSHIFRWVGTHQISFFVSLNTLNNFFSKKKSKTTYYEPLQPISTVFHFLIKLVSIGLNPNSSLSDNTTLIS